MWNASFGRLLAALLILAAAQIAAQPLLFSIRGADLPGNPPLTSSEVLALDQGLGITTLIPEESWPVLIGDRDGNGRLDDSVPDLDAFDAGDGLASSYLASFATDVRIGGQTLRDGDVITWDPTGTPIVLWSEAQIAGWTGTGNIDVDAIARDGNGAVYFSFADDETTTDPGLIAALGGTTIDEQALLRLDPGASLAVVHLSPADVITAFSAAVGRNLRSVVDLAGVAFDPNANGELLLTASSTSSTLAGLVITTAAGGQVYNHGGIPVDATSLGLPSGKGLDALSVQAVLPPELRIGITGSSVSGSNTGGITVSRLSPGERVQFAFSRRNPMQPAFRSTQVSGFDYGFLDVLDGLYLDSLTTPEFLLTAHADGRAGFTFRLDHLMPGLSLVGQAISIDRRMVSNPVTLTPTP